MQNLPIVQSGIHPSLLKSYQDTPVSGQVTYLLNWWGVFRAEQPVLAKMAMREITTFQTAKEAAAFSHGIWIVYSALKSQIEADEMNEAWGD